MLLNKIKLSVILTTSTLLLYGCTGKPEINVDSDPDHEKAMVFYGTDRNHNESGDPEKFYGLRRGSFEYGITRLKIKQRNDKARVESVEPQSRDQFLNQLAKSLDDAESPALFVFVHGYNHSFDQAISLVAEFANNTNFPGVPVVWSWPSSRNPAGYVEDQTNMRWSQPHFAEFLRTIIYDSGAESVHLIGHSMGAWGLTNVMLEEILPFTTELETIGEFVLLAPDIDRELFKRDLAPRLVDFGLSITIYASENDRAMASSWTLHGYPRTGDSSPGPLIIPGIETIDATEANASILGHSYFEESQVVGNDLVLLLTQRTPAEQRPNLTRAEHQGRIFWRLPGDE